MINVKKVGESSYEVAVNAATVTMHTVTLSPSYYQKLTNGRVPAEALIQKSFEFLLEREPNTSILSSFDLQVISRYFPEYERTIGNMLSNT